MTEFHAKAPQATVSEELAQGPHVAARVGVEPMTLRTKGVDSTNAPHYHYQTTLRGAITLFPQNKTATYDLNYVIPYSSQTSH